MHAYYYYIIAAINVLALCTYGLDKLKSKGSGRRISEKTLIILALCAAGPGALLGMILFNHKTSKPKFRYGVPTILALQIVAFYYLFIR